MSDLTEECIRLAISAVHHLVPRLGGKSLWCPALIDSLFEDEVVLAEGLVERRGILSGKVSLCELQNVCWHVLISCCREPLSSSPNTPKHVQLILLRYPERPSAFKDSSAPGVYAHKLCKATFHHTRWICRNRASSCVS